MILRSAVHYTVLHSDASHSIRIMSYCPIFWFWTVLEHCIVQCTMMLVKYWKGNEIEFSFLFVHFKAFLLVFLLFEAWATSKFRLRSPDPLKKGRLRLQMNSEVHRTPLQYCDASRDIRIMSDLASILGQPVALQLVEMTNKSRYSG